ncbi:TDRD1 [Branchiostoma lanceolatum]|uniref:TDRD1 protein n=1 Tax=Branchiostoma lanceolatum TaxID=7740 RepID=A0A8J9ZZC4_BRALA|nr:TDRD1 [Branchiostoma lanceolatum]
MSTDDSSDLPLQDKPCAQCGAAAEQRCGRCLSVYYCSRDHQKEHWKAHRLDCKPYRIERTEDRDMLSTRYTTETLEASRTVSWLPGIKPGPANPQATRLNP